MSENEEKSFEERTSPEKAFPKKRKYRRLSPSKEKKEPEQTTKKGLTQEDIEAFRELAPRLSPHGREVINLLLKVFDDDGELKTDQLLNLINVYAGQNKNNSMSQLLNILPMLTANSQGGGNQPLNPAMLAGLLGMLMPNRPK